MKRLEKLFLTITVALFGFTAGAPAQAELNLSQSPLFLITPVKPALIMAVDNSGSMDGEVIFPTNDGALWWNTDRDSFSDINGDLNFNTAGGANSDWKKYVYLFPNGEDGSNGHRRRYADSSNDHFAIPPTTNFAFARSPAYNAIYFDPSQEYPPFPSEGSDSFGDSDPEAAKVDAPRGDSTFDLTARIIDTRENWVFKMHRDMLIPEGTIIGPADGDECELRSRDGDEIEYGEGRDLRQDAFVDEGSCEMAISYFPATFWLPEEAGVPEGFIGSAIRGGLTPDNQPLLFGYEITPDNFGDAYDEMIQNFANWFSYYRKRSLLTRAAIGRSFEEVDFLRTGFFTINDRDNVDMLNMSDDDDREEFYDWHYDLRGTGGTPNKEAVNHLGNQFKRTSAQGGAPILEACQRNFGMLVTDGFSNPASIGGIDNEDGDLPPPLGDSTSGTMADLAYSFYRDNLRPDMEADRVPTPSACNQANPPLTADCRDDPHMNLFAISLGAKGIEFGVNEAATEDPYANPPAWPTDFPSRHPSAVDDLWHATLNSRGEMFSATNPQELVEALTSVLLEIASRIEPVGVSATSTRLDEDTQFFESELDSTTWSGNLRAIDANENTENWNAENVLPAHGSRTIKTSIGGIGQTFAKTEEVRAALFGDTSIDPLEIARRNRIIDYLRGDQSGEMDNNGPFRDRDGLIGDIANSRPTFVGPINEGWARLDAGYLDYIDPDNGPKKSLGMVLVGANDGMLHAFDSDSGVEKFAYIPSMVHENLPQLADPDYVHRFYVDGQSGIGDIKRGSGWTTVAVTGLGAGGKGVFALDLKTREVIWEIDTDHPTVGNHIGHVFGKPIVTRAGGQWVAVFGNGYNSEDGTAGLIVARMDGSADFVPTNNSTENGLSEVAVFMNPLDRLNALRAYAGDLKGNMWRFDFDGATVPSSEFGSSPLITVDDDRPITSGPTLAALPSGGIMVFFGSGKLLETADRVGDATEFDRFWAVRDRNSVVSPGVLSEAAMASVNGGGRTISGIDDTDGWFLNLGIGNSETGERVLAKPAVTFGRLIFTTFEPDDDPCSPGGVRRIYLLNALNASGQFDSQCPNCGVIEVGLGAPIDPAIVIRPPEAISRLDGENSPFNPGGPDGTLPDGSTVGSVTRWCSTLLIQVAGQGQVPIGNVCDGRQVWRQAR